MRGVAKSCGRASFAIAIALLAAACASKAAAPEATVSPAISAAASATTSTATASNAAVVQTPPLIEATATRAPVAESRPPGAVTAARVVTHGNTTRRMVALTFDAGSDPGYTGEILAVLQREGVRATFSVTGLWAEHNRDLLLAIAAQGHQLINHTYDHASFTGLSTQKPPMTADARALELSRTEVTVYHLTERTTRPYFRPPYGDLDASVQRDAAANGYDTVVMWSVDTMGWNHASVETIVARSIAGAEPGAIYVMHVGAESQDGVALPRIIAALRAQGYTFGTIEEVLAE